MQGGLSESVLRIKDGDARATEHLRRAFRTLFGIHGSKASYDVTVSCNAVLEGHGVKGTSYTLWYGHDYAAGKTKDFMIGDVQRVDSLSDVEDLRPAFPPADFQELFDQNFESSDVQVHSIASVVYKITRYIPHYSRDSLYGRKFTRLF